MPINFPDAPSSGDTHTVGDKTWTYDGTAWTLVTGATADHGNLDGLGDDDHTQYLLADGSRTATELTVSGDLTVDTSTLHVDSTNNRVGIGTTAPTADLEVSGTSPVMKMTDSDSTGTSNAQIQFRDSSDSLVARVYPGGNDLRLDGTLDRLILQTGSTDRVTVDSSGNVGINDTTPSYTLDVNGDINTTGNLRVGGVSVSSNHGWHTRMLSSDAVTLTSSLQWIPFGYDDIDTDSYHDTTTNKTRVTIPSNLGGWYSISMRVAITYVNPPSLLICFCRPNGNGNATTGILVGTVVPKATFGGGGEVSGTIYLPGNTYIEMGVSAVGGSSVTLLGTSTGQYTTVFHGVRTSP